MTTVRRITVSQIEGDNANNNDNNEIRPYGEMAVYVGDNNKLELLMADGIRTNVRNKVLNKGTFYGGDADSGDGAGLDTIKLVPDEELRRSGSDQYLIVDPTAPNHIHIRAGGEIDNSTAELFLGGELNNVRVSDVYNNVVISTDSGSETTKIWAFESTGNLELPTVTFSEEVTEGPGIYWPVTDFNGGSISINTNGMVLRAESNQWTFGVNNGDITFPNGSVQTTAFVQGEYLYEFDGENTDITITDINFNLLFSTPATGYSGSDTHNVNLPAGVPGQRLVILNVSTQCMLTINSEWSIPALSGPAELIYTSVDGWVALYGIAYNNE